MAFTRAKPAGWAFGEVLTSTQMNTADAYWPSAVDGRAAALEVASQSYTYLLSALNASDANAAYTSAGIATQTGVGAASLTDWPILLPNGSIITAFTAYLDGAPGHGGLPGTMPIVHIMRIDAATRATTLVASQVDTSGSVGAYEARHAVSKSGLSITLDRTASAYYLRIDGETGANSVAGLVMDTPALTFTVDRLFIG